MENEKILVAFKNLREIEEKMSEALFQAKEKLKSIRRSENCPVTVDNLVKYAHHISFDYSVAAPLDWQPGDTRRPYPTDVEMRIGWLAKLAELPENEPIPDSLIYAASNLNNVNAEPAVPPSNNIDSFSNVASNESTTWTSQMSDMPKSLEDADVMSTDSSTSSSTGSPG